MYTSVYRGACGGITRTTVARLKLGRDEWWPTYFETDRWELEVTVPDDVWDRYQNALNELGVVSDILDGYIKDQCPRF